MPDVESIVRGHYGRTGLLQRIETGLQAAGVDPQHPRLQDLQAFDQLHGFGLLATEAHADRAQIRAGMRVLDLGCGIGGPARYLAAVKGCKVTAIDLTPAFVEIARELTRRCGVEGIDFQEANALSLPFDAASFDHVWCHNVTMNIADKDGLTREVGRVLRGKGRFSLVETEQGPAGPPRFPLPWASDASSSFLATPERMHAAIEAAGLRILAHGDFRSEVMKRGAPPRQANDITMGDDFATRLANTAAGIEERRLVDQFVLAEKS